MTRTLSVILALWLLVGCVACGSTRAAAAPDVTGQRLDVAEGILDAAGLRYRTVGGGMFGVVVRSRWVVCRQVPAPTQMATRVTLVVARSCAVPEVVGMRLDDAEDALERAGLEIEAHSLDGGAILVRHFWEVCRQGAATGRTVDVFASHDCWDSQG